MAMFTQVSGVNPSSGIEVYPNQVALPDFNWRISGGTYTGYYYINRNDPQGLSYWTQANYTGPIGFNQFYNYSHWTDEHYYDGEVTINSPFNLSVSLFLDDGIQGPSLYQSTVFGNGPGQTLTGGVAMYNYQHTSPNANFIHTITLMNLGPGPVFANRVDITDLDTGYTIASLGGGVMLMPGTPTDFTCGLPFFQRYYITLDIA